MGASSVPKFFRKGDRMKLLAILIGVVVVWRLLDVFKRIKKKLEENDHERVL